MFSRRSPLALGLVLIALLAAARTRAADLPRLVGFPVASVDAGRTVDLAWTPPAGDVEELEILLSVDGGRTFPIRVSPSLEPGTARWRWRVPNLSTSDARLRVRALVDGRETPGPATPGFRIAAAPGRAAERRLVQEGGWWGGFEPVGHDAPPTLPSREPALLDAAAEDTSLSSPPDIQLAAPAPTFSGGASPCPARPVGRALDSPLASRTVPLRN